MSEDATTTNGTPQRVGFWQGVLTGPDDRTYNAVELLAVVSFACGILLSITDFVLSWVMPEADVVHFNALSYFGGVSAGIAAVGAAIRIRDGITSGANMR